MPAHFAGILRRAGAMPPSQQAYAANPVAHAGALPADSPPAAAA
jgi:hypothetical protein